MSSVYKIIMKVFITYFLNSNFIIQRVKTSAMLFLINHQLGVIATVSVAKVVLLFLAPPAAFATNGQGNKTNRAKVSRVKCVCFQMSQ